MKTTMLNTSSLVVVTATTIAGLAVTYLLEIPLAVGFGVGLLLLLALMLRSGLPWKEALHLSFQGALQTRAVVYILLFVALLIPSWSASGIIDAMIGLGLEWFSLSFFLTSSFLLSGVLSYLLGTSTGALSAVGIPIIGMAMQLDIPVAMAAGALVSGAFVGDRGSPISSAFHLTANSTGLTPREHGRAILPTTVMGGLASLLFFAFGDVMGSWSASLPAGVAEMAMEKAGSWWLYLPPLLLLGSLLFRLGTYWAFVLAITSAILVGTVQGGIPAGDWLSILWYGWTNETGYTAKGLLSMLDLLILIAMAGSFNGLLERSGVIAPLIQKVFASHPGLGGSTWRAGLFGLGLGLVSCTQTLPIIMTGRHLQRIWEPRFGLRQLGRVVADTSLLFAALVPWNMLAILCSTILGVPVVDYIPFAVYVWSIPLFTLLYSYVLQGRMGKQHLRQASR